MLENFKTKIPWTRLPPYNKLSLQKIDPHKWKHPIKTYFLQKSLKLGDSKQIIPCFQIFEFR